MTEHGDQLRRAFETHENEGPDPAEVYARVQQLARGYQWRRRGVQAAGGVVLGAGLIAGVMNISAVLPAGPNDNAAVQAGGPAAPASPVVSVAPSARVQIDPNQDEFDAYFGAGYGYDEAVKLAKIWKKSQNDLGTVKAEAGKRLLAGETLPVKPDPDRARIDAYFGAGYGYDEAVKLAKLWKMPKGDIHAVKAEAGKRLLAGQTLPVKPPKEHVQDAQETAQLDAYFAADYDYNDAVKLAKLWKLKDPYAAKVAGGKKLLAGETLPIRP
ncbi:hypothetical protein [Actinoplanes sp. NPDC026623]|uniref:hypothetical protein n=1 Tax=Actinoplanes sp. NPDC026623 TaxID=3155610 RepID=UPI003402E900